MYKVDINKIYVCNYFVKKKQYAIFILYFYVLAHAILIDCNKYSMFLI